MMHGQSCFGHSPILFEKAAAFSAQRKYCAAPPVAPSNPFLGWRVPRDRRHTASRHFVRAREYLSPLGTELEKERAAPTELAESC
jgi:hypothetical protein